MPQRLTVSGVAALCIAAAFLLLLVALGIQTARIEGFKVWPISVKGYKAENGELRAKLNKISTEKNEQKSVTKANVDKARVIYREAEGRARVVESAPLPGQCKTPAEVMGADL